MPVGPGALLHGSPSLRLLVQKVRKAKCRLLYINLRPHPHECFGHRIDLTLRLFSLLLFIYLIHFFLTSTSGFCYVSCLPLKTSIHNTTWLNERQVITGVYRRFVGRFDHVTRRRLEALLSVFCTVTQAWVEGWTSLWTSFVRTRTLY